MTSPTADQRTEGTTAEPQGPPASLSPAPLAPPPLTLAPVPGLQAIGGDAVGFCGPDGCYPAPHGTPTD
jgi:hypothetical protein